MVVTDHSTLTVVAQADLKLAAIEPQAEMREICASLSPDIEVLEGTGEQIPLPNSSAQAIISGQAFHWMATAACLQEVHRVLIPGGLFAVLWTTRDVRVPWIAALDGIYDEFYAAQPDVPRQHGKAWMKPFEVSFRETLIDEIVSLIAHFISFRLTS